VNEYVTLADKNNERTTATADVDRAS